MSQAIPVEGIYPVKPLRVVEVYGSFQGEGPNTGRPTIFVRFAGCNFKCPGWPCDTQHAIDPKQFTSLQKFWEPKLLAEYIAGQGIGNVCLTGGEVFLQNQDALYAFLDYLQERTGGKVNIECFTNGGLMWEKKNIELIQNFILDWKLPGSGEAYENDGAFLSNFTVVNNSHRGDAVKFTIKDREDYDTAVSRYQRLINKDATGPQVYAGVVWGAMETETLAAWMLGDHLPWSLNVQVHKFIWHPDKIGV